MRGYFTAGGFFGLVDGEYRLFASESDYYESVDSDGEDLLSDLDLCLQFLPDLTPQRLLRAFSQFYLTARELPEVLKVSISALCGKDTVSLKDDRCHDLYRFH